MEKEMEKQTDTKVKNSKLNLIVIVLIILISLLVLAITLNYFLFEPDKENVSTENTLHENSTQETNSPIISLIPTDKNEIDDIQNTIEENTTQEIDNTNQNTNNISSNISENTVNTIVNSNSNTNGNTNTNTNTNTNSSGNNNANNSSNSSGNSNTETNSTPETPSTPVVKPYKVKTETSTELTKTETKYGVLIKTYTTSTYDLYSDGSKKIINSSDRVEYDRTNYTATTSELLPEARAVRSQYSSMINQVFKNTNTYRQEANRNSVNGVTNRNNLSLNENLCVAACARAVEMAYSSKFSHTRPNGSKCYTILKEMNISYSTAGENISYGYSSADSVSEGWKNSQGHYENMILPDFSQIGIGVFKIEGTYYWVQIFN